jgi:drug/metabolite transporter (DMT)-like permease
MLSLPIWALLPISISGSVTCSIVESYYSRRVGSSRRDIWFFTMLQSVVTAALLLVLRGGIGPLSLYSLLTGAGFGVVCTLQVLTFMIAISIGPISYTSVIVSLSTLIPTVAGSFFWNETISASQWIGIALMAVCILFSTDKKAEGERRGGKKWVLICLISTLLNGMVGLLQKIHQTSVHRDEVGLFLVTCFAVSAAFAAGMSLFSARRQRTAGETAPRSASASRWRWAAPVICGAALAFPHLINLHLSGVLPAAVMFPLVNIVPLVLVTALAALLFRERLSLQRWIGLGIGVASMLFISGVVSF